MLSSLKNLIIVAHAQTGQSTVTLINPLGSNATFSSVTASLIKFLLYDVAIPLTTIMALVGAFQMITASGDPEKFSKGRKTLLYAAAGFGVVLIASGIASLIQSIISG